MTSELRQLIRQAIDRRTRLLLADSHEEGSAGCGGPRSGVTAGCKRCWERARARRRWADPEFRRRQHERRVAARRRQRESEREVAA